MIVFSYSLHLLVRDETSCWSCLLMASVAHTSSWALPRSHLVFVNFLVIFLSSFSKCIARARNPWILCSTSTFSWPSRLSHLPYFMPTRLLTRQIFYFATDSCEEGCVTTNFSLTLLFSVVVTWTISSCLAFSISLWATSWALIIFRWSSIKALRTWKERMMLDKLIEWMIW